MSQKKVLFRDWKNELKKNGTHIWLMQIPLLQNRTFLLSPIFSSMWKERELLLQVVSHFCKHYLCLMYIVGLFGSTLRKYLSNFLQLTAVLQIQHQDWCWREITNQWNGQRSFHEKCALKDLGMRKLVIEDGVTVASSLQAKATFQSKKKSLILNHKDNERVDWGFGRCSKILI